MTSPKSALITGITGQDGSYLAEFLLAKGYTVIGLARRSTHPTHNNIAHLSGKITLEYGDLIDADYLNRIVASYRPDEVYNLAAQSVPADSWNQPIATAEITALAPLRLLEALRRHCPQTRFYQASSREIYGGVQQQTIDENTPLKANNPYGIAKLYAHQITETYRQSYGLFACGGILFNHESPRRSLHFISRKVTVAAACIKLGIADPPLNELGQPLVCAGKLKLGDLTMVRDWGYAKEYVEAMWLMLQQETPQDYIIATNTAFTIADLCQVAFARLDLDWRDHVLSDQAFLRPYRNRASRGDFSKAKAELAWEPRTYFEDLIKLMVDADLQRLAALKTRPS